MALKLAKKSGTSVIASNVSPSAPLDLTNLDISLANLEKVILQNVYHEKMLLYRDHQVSYSPSSKVSQVFMLYVFGGEGGACFCENFWC